MDIRLEILKQSDEEQFIKDDQASFNTFQQEVPTSLSGGSMSH